MITPLSVLPAAVATAESRAKAFIRRRPVKWTERNDVPKVAMFGRDPGGVNRDLIAVQRGGRSTSLDAVLRSCLDDGDPWNPKLQLSSDAQGCAQHNCCKCPEPLLKSRA